MNDHHQTSFEWSAGILFVTAHGPATLASFVQMIQRISEEVRSTPAKGVFLDVRDLMGSFSDLDRYQVGVAGSEAKIRVPIAVLGHEPMIDPKKLGELVAQNRGLNVRVFTDIMKAVTWLSKFKKVRHFGAA